MNTSPTPNDEQLKDLFATLEASESSIVDDDRIQFSAIQAEATRRGQSRRRRRNAYMGTACIALLAFAGWWSVQEASPKPDLPMARGVNASPDSMDSLVDASVDLQDTNQTVAMSDSVSPPLDANEKEFASATVDPVRDLLERLSQFESETNRITAELRSDSVEQRIARSERELLQTVRLRSRSEFLLSLN